MQPKPLTTTTGTLLRYENFPSQAIPPRHVDIWLPAGYDPASAAGYPVLYMHDGQNLFLTQNAYGGTPWAVDVEASRLIDAGSIPPVIVVGAWNVGENRWGEYLPQKPAETAAGREFFTRYANRMPGELCSNAYLRFLVEELKPFVDQHYRTRPGQTDTFVMGSSMGGLISLYALTEYPQVFGGAGCVSTHWTAGENLMVDYFAGVLPKPGVHRLYFDFGTETLDAAYEPFQRRMDDHLRRAGYTADQDWMTRKFEGHEHCEKSWRERVHIPLMFLLGKR